MNVTFLTKAVELLQVDEYLNQLPIKELPGIGYALEEKLKKQNVWTCGQLRTISKVCYVSFLIVKIDWQFLLLRPSCHSVLGYSCRIPIDLTHFNLTNGILRTFISLIFTYIGYLDYPRLQTKKKSK